MASASAYDINAGWMFVEPLEVASQRFGSNLTSDYFRNRYAQRLLNNYKVGFRNAKGVHISGVEFPATGNGGHDVCIVKH